MCKGCEPLRRRLIAQAEKTATFARAARIVAQHDGSEVVAAFADDAAKLAAEFAGPAERHGKPAKTASAARPPRRAVPTPPPAGSEKPATLSDDPAQQTLL